LTACRAEDPLAERDDRTAVFCKRYEDCGRNQTASRMLPSDQSFKADNAPINQRFRLIDKLKFAFFEGRHEVVLNLATFAQLAIHFRLEEPVETGTFRLG